MKRMNTVRSHMKASKVVAGLLALVAACGPNEASESESPSTALEFTSPRVVSLETDNGATPMLFTTSGGDRVLAWVSAEGGGEDGRLHFSVTRAKEPTPRETVTVSDPLGPIEPHGEAPPKIAEGDEGELHVLYAVGKVVPGLRFPLSSLRLIRSDDLGATWSDPVTVNDGEKFGSNNFHALTAAAGLVVVTWLESDRDFTRVAMSRSFDRGETWEARQTINVDPGCECCRTSVAIHPDGEMYVAWRTIAEGEVRDIVVARSPDLGDTWEEAVRPRADDWIFPACPHAGPSLRIDETGVLHIAWWTGKEGEAGVYYARSKDGGRTWAAHPIAIGDRSVPAHVQVETEGRHVLVAWDDGLADMPSIMLRRSTDGGGTFLPAQRVSEAGFAATFPVLTMYGGLLSIAWSQRGEQSYRETGASHPDMSDPDAVMELPRVGQSEIFLRLTSLD